VRTSLWPWYPLPLMSHSVTHSSSPSLPLTADVVYGRSLMLTCAKISNTIFYYRSTLQYTSADTPFLPVRNNLQPRCNGRGPSPPRFEKDLTRKCSWRCVAIFFVVLAIILSAALAYITGKCDVIYEHNHTELSCLHFRWLTHTRV